MAAHTQTSLQPCDKQRLLIVDDEPMIRTLFERLLNMGFPDRTIDLAVNGAEGVESFRIHRHAVIVMDLMMPVMGGDEAFRRIRQLCEEENIETPCVVFCTGYDPPGSLKGYLDGAPRHTVLRKPITAAQLIDTVSSRLELPPADQ